MGSIPDVTKKCVNSLQTSSRYLGGKEQMENMRTQTRQNSKLNDIRNDFLISFLVDSNRYACGHI